MKQKEQKWKVIDNSCRNGKTCQSIGMLPGDKGQ